MNPASLAMIIEIRCTKTKTIMNVKNPRTLCFLGQGHTNKPTGKLRIANAKMAAKTPPNKPVSALSKPRHPSAEDNAQDQ
jgi:hypothetical protein